MPKKLRWGILSTARIADAQVRAIQLSSNCELVAVASRDVNKAKEWAQKRNVPRALGSYDELLASDEIDAVYNPLPNSMHAEWSIRALEAGKHVLCEKPMASNARQVEAMIAASEKNGVKLMEGFMYRFHPQIARVRQMIEEGAIGEIKILRATFGFFLTDPSNIRLSNELHGGGLMDVGCYCVNALRLFAQAEPISVEAKILWAATGVDESLVATLEFPNRVLGTLDCGLSFDKHQWIGISGTKGHLGLTHPFNLGEEPATILYDHAGKSETIQVAATNHYCHMLEHFADAVLNQRALAFTPQDSLANMRVIDALYESGRTGRRVEVGS